MKKLAVVALVFSVFAICGSAAALWRTRDIVTTPSENTTSTTTAAGLVVVPFEAGVDAYQAGADLKAVGLNFAVVEAPSVTVPKGRVLSQSPLEGTTVPLGTVVLLTVSSGSV
jgi:beta-lactam-binding protein with PASTA domain